jgi:cell division protein FtsQ
MFPWKMMLWFLIPALLVASFMFARNWLNDGSHLTISNVAVVGELKYSDPDVIRTIIEPFITTNLHLLDAKAMEEELEFEPWIKSVAITKRWPSELVVEVIEQTPVAFWGDDRLVNHLGEIFDATLESQKGIMPMLYHPEDKGLEMIERYKTVQQWLKAATTDSVGVSELIVNASGAWQIRLTNDWLLEVGKIEQKKRLRRFLVAYKKELAGKASQVKKIDLRYTNGLVVSWK